MKNATNTTGTEQTAATLYAARQADIARLIDVLQMELEKHANDAAQKPRDYGFAGDLGTIRANLIAAVAQITRNDSTDTAEIEDFLTNAI